MASATGATKPGDTTSDPTTDPGQNSPDATLKRTRANQMASIVIGEYQEMTDTSPDVNSVGKLYAELNESENVEIYLERSETENAVAELEKSTANEMFKQDEEVENVNFRFICEKNRDYSNAVYDISDNLAEISDEKECSDVSFPTTQNTAGHEGNSDGDDKVSHKRRCESPTTHPQSKRQKTEVSENSNGELFSSNSPLADNNMNQVKIEQSNNNQRGFSADSTLSKAHSAIESSTPVAIVTPLGLKEDFFSENISSKGESGNEKEIENLKNDISAILDSFKEDTCNSVSKESVNKNQDVSSSIKLTDTEFEKFKNDLFSDQSFKTADGINWTFSTTPKRPESKSPTVQSEIGDFEKILNNYMKKCSSEKSTQSNFISSSSIPVQRPFKGYRKDFDYNDPSVVLANSELLRELLDDKPDKNNSNKSNSKRPANVDLSFLQSDMLASKRNTIPVSSVLKTKTIEPTAMSPNCSYNQAFTNNSSASIHNNIKKEDSDIIHISVPNENEAGAEAKSDDPGPLSLAEQRRASVTLHHKVPSISDLVVAASGPLNKMDGDETEAILNEIIGSPVADGFGGNGQIFTSPVPQNGLPDLKNGFENHEKKFPMTPSPGLPQTTMSEFMGRYPGNGMHMAMNKLQDQQGHMQIGNPLNTSKPSSAPDYWNVDFENMPPERRQILAARYGHLMRYKRDMVTPVQERNSLNQPYPQLHRQNSMPLPNNHVYPSRNEHANAFLPQNQKPGDFSRGEFLNTNSFNAAVNPASDPKLNPAGSAGGGPGAMNDQMRYLMMQQLHRRRMMAQGRVQQDPKSEPPSALQTSGNPITAIPGNQFQQMPQGVNGQPMRPPSGNNGSFHGYPFSASPEAMAARLNQQQNNLVSHPGSKLYAGNFTNSFQRQMSQPTSMGPLVSSKPPSMMQASSGNGQFHFEGDPTQGRFQEIPPIHRQMPNYHMQGQNPHQYNRNQNYLQSSGAFSGQMANSFRNASQPYPGIPTGNDGTNNGMLQKEQQTYGHHNVDFF